MTNLPGLNAWRFLAFGVVVGLRALGLLVRMALPHPPRVLEAVGQLAANERDRVGRYLATPVPLPSTEDSATTVRRDVRWLVLQATTGILAGLLPVGSVTGVVQNVLIAAFWPFVPEVTSTLGLPVRSWSDAALTLATAAAYGLMGALLVPPLGRWYAKVSAARLAPPVQSLAERLAEVTATRAAALDAHGIELQRIERSLHDGTQNRLVAVVMQLGLVERALMRDPAAALPSVLAAQNAATDALAELRQVVRSIYPAVLAERGLSEAVASLAAQCAIPCTLDEHPLPRAPAAVEAAAYFVVAEALTNAVKHSGADRIIVSLRGEDGALVVEVTDNGHGGADDGQGTGLRGIHHRIAAFDGTTKIDSPSGGPTVVRVAIPAGP
ncbi:sensor histidine kinase [Lentzea aerocolonigenes]|uniref:sensor histidine kinase n=1 Tax=Lentzea aerocolonigenes TaxID=68170 RepID=UPI0004C35610|nr:histidine kinase [Lentzea aerocolonigenes]MCP2250680.1 Signal transduction histidine kinase [Lentzea aerocolonigenes]